MDEVAARTKFEAALADHKPEFGSFFLARFLGLDITYEDAACVLEFDVSDFMYNPQQSLHGGVIALALDVSMGHLIKHTTGHGGATLDLAIQYVRPVIEGRVRCRAEYAKQGRTVSFLESRMTDSAGKLVAKGSAVFHLGAQGANVSDG